MTPTSIFVCNKLIHQYTESLLFSHGQGLRAT